MKIEMGLEHQELSNIEDLLENRLSDLELSKLDVNSTLYANILETIKDGMKYGVDLALKSLPHTKHPDNDSANRKILKKILIKEINKDL